MTIVRKTAPLAVGLLATLTVSVFGQNADFSIPSTYTDWDNAQWVLSTNKLIQGQYQARLPLANGYLGCAHAAAGPFFEGDKNLTNPDGGNPILNGWPLDNPRQTFCTIANFWDSQPNTTRSNFPWLLQYGGESVISGVPHWGGLIFDFNGAHLDAEVSNTTIRSFKSSLSAKQGVATWAYTWVPAIAGGATFDITYTAFVSRTRPNAAVIRADITASRDIAGTVTDLLDGRGAVRTTFAAKSFYNDQGSTAITTSVHPLGLSNITAQIVSTVTFAGAQGDVASRRMANQSWVPYANESTIAQAFDLHLRAGETATIFKFIGGASSDAFPDPAAVARNASACAAHDGWDALLAEHTNAWAQLMTPDAVDDYTKSDGWLSDDVNVKNMQITSVMTPYYLLQNTLRADAGPNLAKNSISVGGLTSDVYAGFVFWDAELFMSPGLLVAHPEYARQIANYRIALAPQARVNAAQAGFTDGAVLFPWTSGRFGNCTGTGPCSDYQYHINSDIALMLLQHRNVTGDEKWWREQAWPVYNGVAIMFSELLKFNATTQRYTIKNMTDPDEYANGVDNGGFTLASASQVLTTANYFRQLYGQPINDTWTQIANNVAIPYDHSGITIEYDGMNNSVPVKQADIVLNTYPLDYRSNYSAQQSLNDLDYYAGKQSPDGPAMTYGILSIIANQVSPSGCSAYTYALDAFEPYTRAPWYQFSEQQNDVFEQNGGTRPAFPFLTGHGGFNQIGPFGWLGMRTDRPTLVVDPALPPQIPKLKVRAVYFNGARVKAVMNHTHTVLTRLASNNSFVTDNYGTAPMPIVVGEDARATVSLLVNQSVTIPNRPYTDQLTIAHNLLQCLPATSPDAHQPGQYPLGAIDGAISTEWRPVSADRTSMVVNLESVDIQPVVGIAFNWGLTPPQTANVILCNSSTFDGPAFTIPISNISVSDAYNASDVRIQPYKGNTTNLAIAASSPIYTGRYAKLEIQGTQGPLKSVGGSVAEFALIGALGRDMVRQWPTIAVYQKVQ
ncbi:MAG: hypothetical protein M1826_006844 [Phylliscum demangeonii]|nr:MAG: hypothetical protein M1826_006844 [Phylliscum demangeonii]